MQINFRLTQMTNKNKLMKLNMLLDLISNFQKIENNFKIIQILKYLLMCISKKILN